MIQDNTQLQTLHSCLLEILCEFDLFCREHDISYTLAYGSVLGAVRHGGFIPWDDDLDVCMTADNYNKFIRLYKNNDDYTLQRDTIDYPLQFSKLRKNNTTFIESIPYRKKYKKIHQGVYLDIFCLDKVAENYFARKIQIVCSNILIAQSLQMRGYSTNSPSKKIMMMLSILLRPIRKWMLEYVRSFNEDESLNLYCDFFGETTKYFFPTTYFHSSLSCREFENHSYPVPNFPEEYLKKIYGDWQQLPSQEEQDASVHAKFFSTTESYHNFL